MSSMLSLSCSLKQIPTPHSSKILTDGSFVLLQVFAQSGPRLSCIAEHLKPQPQGLHCHKFVYKNLLMPAASLLEGDMIIYD